jgi:hypothetical protein
VKLWSYGGQEIPRAAMKAVRRALNEITALKLDLWSEDGAPSVAVDRSGHSGASTGPEAQRAEPPARGPWEFLKLSAEHNGRSADDVWAEFKLPATAITRNPLA